MPTPREVIEDALHRVVETIQPAEGEVGRLAEAWLARVIETCQAVLILNSQGYGAVAAPMRRSVVEHALWLSWITRHRDDARAIVEAKHRKSVKQRERVLRAWSDRSAAQVDRVLATAERGVPTMADVIKDLTETAGEGATLPEVWFGVYWSDSEASHPSLSTARPNHETTAESWDLALSCGLILALHSYSRLLPGDPWDPWIREAMTAIQESVGPVPG